MRSVLIVRTGALGDAILTLPLIEALDKAGVGRIAILGTPSSWAFLAPSSIELFDLGDRDWLGLFDDAAPLGPQAQRPLTGFDTAFILLGRERKRVESALHRHGIDNVVGAAPAPKDAAVRRASSIATAEFVELPWPPAMVHAASRILRAFEAHHELGFASDWPPAPTPFGDRERLRIQHHEIERAWREAGFVPPPPRAFLAIHAGSGSAAKCWPAVQFAKLAEAIEVQWGMASVFVVGPADAKIWGDLQALLPQGLRKRVIANRPLREVLAVLSTARAYVGNDSGISHLAGMACPTLTLFGPTDASVWHPLGPRVVTLRAPRGRLEDLPLGSAMEALAKIL